LGRQGTRAQLCGELVSELSIASLRQTRRQIELIEQQGLGDIPLHIVMNRVEKSMFKSINMADATRALGRHIDFTVANDFETMSAALDRGILVSEVSKRSRVTKDIGMLADALEHLTIKASR
jgi:pilus assembly protein CpaE